MQQETKPNFWALTPLIVFLSIYLIASIIMGDFYKMPITVAFLVSSVVAVAISSGGKLPKRHKHAFHGSHRGRRSHVRG